MHIVFDCNTREVELLNATAPYFINVATGSIMPKRRRDCVDLIFEILKLAAKGTTKTQAMYGANLNSRLARDYFNPLAKQDYLRLIQATDETPKYFLTNRGKLLMDDLEHVRAELAQVFVNSENRNDWCPSDSCGLKSRIELKLN